MADLIFLLVSFVNLVLLALWLVLAVLALVRLGRENLSGIAKAIWAALILLVPIMGAAAFFIVNAQYHQPEDTSSAAGRK